MHIRLEKWVLIAVGTTLMAAAVKIVYLPMNMVTGGVAGIAIVVQHLTKGIMAGGIPIWITNACLNIPLFVVAFRVKGKKFIYQTLFATVCYTVALYFIPSFMIIAEDHLLAAIIGGSATGIGLGLVFSTSTCTGGSDLLGSILQKYLKHYSVAEILFLIDGIIVITGAIVFGLNKALYSVIAVFITSKVTDTILEGFHFAKLAFIISEEYSSIADEILTRIHRGATAIPAKGMYSNNDKKMLFCAVSQKEIVKLVDIVAQKDPHAFVIISDVREVMGEGFIEYKQ